MLKTLREIMTKKLILIFQICINVEYHSKSFRETKTIVFKKMKKSDYIFSKVYRSIALLNTMNKILGIGNEAPGRPPGTREEKGHMGGDGECLPGTYPAQNDTRKIKAVKFKR